MIYLAHIIGDGKTLATAFRPNTDGTPWSSICYDSGPTMAISASRQPGPLAVPSALTAENIKAMSPATLTAAIAQEAPLI